MRLAMLITILFWGGIGLLMLQGCDEIKEIPKELDPIDNSGTPTPTPEDVKTNPVCDRIENFRDGGGNNLWKPSGDHSNSLVVLFNPKFHVAFDSCKVTRKNGDTEDLRFTGFSNGDRQTWRGKAPGARYVDNGRVTCAEFKQICTFQFQGDSGRRHD